MEFQFFREPVQFCIIRNYHNPDELEAIHAELESLKPHLQQPKQSGTAQDLLGKPKKRNAALFLDQHYARTGGPSHILNLNAKLFTEAKFELVKHGWVYKYLETMNHCSTLVSYYKDGDYYKAHTDQSVLTATLYTWKEPCEFSGGEFYFGDVKIPIENNCMVIFPSCTEHRVTQVKGEGRWAITQFVSSKDTPNPNILQFENFLPVADFNQMNAIIAEGPWKFSGSSGLNGDTLGKFWYMELTGIEFFSRYLFEKIPNGPWRLERVYANGQTFGQDGDYHQDDTRPDAWTFLLYTNTIPDNDYKVWGGETIFEEPPGELRMCSPITNRAVLFRSSIMHKGLGPTRWVRDMRVTVAWKITKSTVYL
jgi:predicted 2-oxoglutarate/Fe(II)-dependent dioxygenase YbiX